MSVAPADAHAFTTSEAARLAAYGCVVRTGVVGGVEVDAIKEACEQLLPALFTEKPNLKQPHFGRVNPLHQDCPYWTDITDAAPQVGTAMLFHDDASRSSACLEVVSGRHRLGQRRTRGDADVFVNNELDVAAYPGLELRAVEVPAGSVVFFGASIAHKLEPNRSPDQRRADGSGVLHRPA